MKSTNVVLSTYTGETVRPLGEAHVKVEYMGSQHTLPLLIVHEGTGALFGRNWLTDVKLDWKNLPGLNHVGPLPCRPSTHPETLGNQTLASVLEKYSELFQPQLGCYTGDPVVLNESKEAKFHKARPVPYALQSKVESALLKMEKDGVIERVTSANSAAPIVVVGKKDSEDVRVCGDFSVTYNASAHVETYPMLQTLSFKRMHGVQCPGYKAGLSSSTNCTGVPVLSYDKHSHWVVCIQKIAEWHSFWSCYLSENHG